MGWPVALRMLEIMSEAAGAQLENQNRYQTCGARRYQKPKKTLGFLTIPEKKICLIPF